MREPLGRPDGWDTWSDEQKAAYNAVLRAELARLKGRAWEKLARPKQLAPDHPRHSAADENGYRCGCAAGDPEWRTWLLMAGRGVGKRLDVDTPIPVPGGWARLGDLAAGDYVFDHAGSAVRVLAVYDGMPAVAYRVTFSDGSVLDADADHLWVTWTYLERVLYLRAGARSFGPAWPDWESANGTGPKVRTTKEIAATISYGPGNSNHSIPVCGALNLPEADLPVDPYVLGAWLGNGTSREAQITIFDDDAGEMLAYLAEGGAAVTGRVARRTASVRCATYTVGGTAGHGITARDPATGRIVSRDCLQSALRALGVLNNKHVPALYLRASAGQRLALLHGLMDTDGGWSGGTVEFTSVNYRLASAVAELARSLGQKAVIHEGRAKLYGRDCGPKWRVTWSPTVNVFRISRKADRFTADRPQVTRHHHRMIRSAEIIDPKPMRCITVDSPHGLFLAGEAMIPTHNTWVGSNWILSQALSQPGTFWGVAAPTIGDVERTCFLGESGILSVAEPGDIPPNGYNVNKARVTLSNHSVIQGFSADSAERARGANLFGCWCDELALFKYESFYHEVLQPALRRGDARMLITTTPKRMRLLRQILRKADDPGNHIHITRASSDENPHFSKVRLAEIKSNYAGTRLYKQEIEGVFNDDVAGAFFSLDMISEARVDRAEVPDLARVVVSIDPAQTASEGADESGIIVAGDDGAGHAYVLADYSLRGSPDQVMRRAVDAWRAHSADCIVFEDQSGGDWLVTALRHVDANVPYKKVHAMRGKYLRAQPVAMLMEQKRIHHAGTADEFERLEDQLCAITEDSDRSKAHDDRADAYVYAIAELRGLSGGSYLSAYSMVKCEDCKKVYRDDRLKCPQCGLEREVFDPPDRRKGPGAQFREGEGEAGWREVYAPRPESDFDRQYRLLQQAISGQHGQMGGPRQSWGQIWKRGRYR